MVFLTAFTLLSEYNVNINPCFFFFFYDGIFQAMGSNGMLAS